MKRSDFEKEFDNSEYICPFKKQKCSLEQCTHFKSSSNHYAWYSEVNLYDQGRCYAGGSIVELWNSRFTIRPAFKNIPFWTKYRKYKNEGENIIDSLFSAYMHEEKIPYDFEEIFKQIKAGEFNPAILPLKPK